MTSRLLAAHLALLLFLVSCSSGPRGDPARGEALYRQNPIGGTTAPGCATCHSVEPERVIVGPSHAGVASRAREIVSSPEYSGEAETVEAYLRESIVRPDAYIGEGFKRGVMYQRYPEALTDQDIEDLVAFLLTLE